jgi:osmoprotectant transport system ATP-binding protein
VAVDEDGVLIGGVTADDVLAALNSQRREALPKLGSDGKG